ncbi:MAG: phosphocholine cytidylyltransferase family protein [Patescibacteria group bacterium]
MKAIILAAGSGTRLGKYTENLPKCMLEFKGKSLIERAVETLHDCGINDVTIVKGYQGEKITIPGVKYYVNEDFSNTNMVETLVKAEAELVGETLVLYADIIFEKSVLLKAIESKVDVGVTVDTDYWDYWKARLDEPEKDTESLVIDGDKIVELGDTKCGLEKAKVRYVGILKFSAKGVESLKNVYHKNRALYFESDEKWLNSKCFKKAYMTCMLQALINEGNRVEPIHISHGWMEFDTTFDLERANEWDKNGTLKRFINI